MRAIRFAYKPVVFLACLAPLLWLVARALEAGAPGLGPNPVEVIQDTLGIWGLRFILITLAVTPFRRIIGAAWPAQFRRMLGLFAFSYISLHFLAYLLLDQTLDMAAIIEDIAERPYITIGFSAWTLMTPLAITSTKGWRRRLRKRWQSGSSVYYVDAEVTDVQPIIRIVEISTPRQTCWDEPVQPTHARHAPKSYTSTVLGGILGGVVGNQFGSGSGKDAMTVAGVLLGASIGRDVANRRRYASGAYYTSERRCEIDTVVRQEERIEGYRVTYLYQGQTFVARLREDPGPRIRIRVRLDPVTYNSRAKPGHPGDPFNCDDDCYQS
jgi:sulfoxide reductase heme-binding subunit YedZ